MQSWCSVKQSLKPWRWEKVLQMAADCSAEHAADLFQCSNHHRVPRLSVPQCNIWPHNPSLRRAPHSTVFAVPLLQLPRRPRTCTNSTIRFQAGRRARTNFVHITWVCCVCLHGNLWPKYLHRFWDIARYCSKIADFNLYTPLVFDAPTGISLRCLATVRRCFRDSTFSRFGTIPACDRQTDGQIHDDSTYHSVAR